VKLSPFLYFLTLHLRSEIRKSIDIILLSTVLLSVLIMVMMSGTIYQKEIQKSLATKSDFVMQNRLAGQRIDTPQEWLDKLYEIRGVSDISPRVYVPYDEKITLLGVDFLEDNADKNIDKIIKSIDLKKFLSDDFALVSPWFQKDLNSTLKIGKKKLKIFPLSPQLSSLLPKNTILLNIDTLKEVANLNESFFNDILFNVPNDDEWSMVEQKIDSLFFTSQAISKEEMTKAYSKMFNFKGGFFLILYLMVIAIFSLILNSRYSQQHSKDRRFIGILKGVGWSIKDILYLKLIESFIIIFISFGASITVSYFGLKLFLGYFGGIFFPQKDLILFNNIDIFIDFSTLFSIFLVFAIPFVASVIVPVWRVAIIEPKEAME